MANLNDVLRDVLEKDFDKDTVDRVLDEGDETDEEKREHTADSQEESEAGYVGPDMAEYHSVGRVRWRTGLRTAFMKSIISAVKICVPFQKCRRLI